MSIQRFLFITLLCIILILPASVPAALAQQPAPVTAEEGAWPPPRLDLSSTIDPAARPPQPARYGPPGPAGFAPTPGQGSPISGAVQTADGLWMMPADVDERLQATGLPEVAPQASGGPDDFGYTFATAPLNWIDASGGTDTGISASQDSAGPIDIGFPFKYYENAYNQLWVSRYGFLTFNDADLFNSQSPVPSPELPNDVIAPHWIPSYNSPNYVRYLRGGSPPHRWFVMEWNRQRSDCCSGDPANDEFTFQAILYENGDIVFQYLGMTIVGDYYCMASGIEDSTGIDGLSITGYCDPVASNQAVRITRPAPAARVRIFPQYYDAFIYPGQVSLTEIPIRNTGDWGDDTYDLKLNSSWTAGLFHADGVTPLSDTNGNGLPDTGPVPQGQSKTVIIKVWSSVSAPIGNHNTASVTARSWLDPTKARTVTSRIAVPTSFAQVYRDDADGAMSLMLVKPQAQTLRRATPNWYWGDDISVAELPNHNQIYLWDKGRCLDANCSRYAREIEYTILNPYGETVRPVARLTDHSGAAFSTYDYPGGVAVTPDGRAGVVWYRYLWNASTSQYNYNIYWAALDVDGALAVAPKRVTNNTVWGSWSALNVPSLYNPRVAATGDQRFVLAWNRQHQENAGYVADIWYAVLDRSGGVVRNPTKLTDSSPGSSVHYSPALAPLASNRTFLSWATRKSGNDDIFFAVLDSSGGLVKAATDLSVDETVIDWNNFGAVQFSGGKILAVWEAWGCFPGEWVPRIRYVLLDSAYNRIDTPTCLENNAAAHSGDLGMSLTSDGANRAVLTWMDSDSSYWRNLYYALVNANGVVVTPATIFQTSAAAIPYIFSSFTGYGNTTYSWTPPAGVDSELSATPSTAPALPGGPAVPITIKLKGRGDSPATSVRLTATLDPRLNYVGDTSGVTPTVSGQTITWDLPDLRLYDIRQFQINLETTANVLGDLLPMQLQLTSAEPDLTPVDNQATVQVWVSQPLYLPLVIKQ